MPCWSSTILRRWPSDPQGAHWTASAPGANLAPCAKCWAVAGLIGLYAVDLAGFYALGVVGVQVLQALAGLGAAGLAVFGAVFRLSLQRKRRLRHVKPKEGVRNQVGIDQAIAMRDIADGGLVGPRWPRVPVAAGPDGRANRRPVQMHEAARKPIWPAGR